jgi:DNA repair protein SbcD/Mre11
MVKFAHLADVHLGSWKQQEMQDLNFESFKKAISICLKEKVEFILIAGDLFDSAYPSIEVLKQTFAEFKKIYEARIPVFLIAGSHDYSVSGKTFLDVLEHAGFCKNFKEYDKIGEYIYLNPFVYEGVAIYGYPGKKAGLEIQELKKLKINSTPGLYRILMLHTTIDLAKGSLPIDSVETSSIPQADYYALGHLHIDFEQENFVYPGPIFPNNFQELEDLRKGSFYIVDTNSNRKEKIELKTKEIEQIVVEIKDATTATEKIIEQIEKKNVEDKIVLLRVYGEIENGKNSDIKFDQITEFAKQKGAYFLLKNTHDLNTKDLMEFASSLEITNKEEIEEKTIENFCEEEKSEFDENIIPLMHALEIEKQEDESNENFMKRILEGTKEVLRF